MSQRIAIIGGGIAGLTAAYLLHKRYDVTLFERTKRLGGNAYTLKTRDGYTMDIAVAAFGRAGYKNFFRLLSRLDIPTIPSVGSAFFSIHNLESRKGLYLTPRLSGLLKQRFALLKTSTVLSLAQLHLGLGKLQKMHQAGSLEGTTVEECLTHIPELTGPARLMFLCVLSLLSSMGSEEILTAPAPFFAEQLQIHNDVLSPKAFYSVCCVRGGTRRYIQALAAGLRKRIVLESKIRTLRRRGTHVTVVLENGGSLVFDKVILACPADEAFRLLESPTDRERNLLGVWRYTEGRIVVHRDMTFFPKRELIQGYTFLYTERGGRFQTSVNGALWHQPGVRKDCPYISSQHPNFPIRPERMEFETVLRTPIFDRYSYRTLRDLCSLNVAGPIYYCGSYFGHGLHEDAVSSAIEVARLLGVRF